MAVASAEAHQEEIAEFSAGLVREKRAVGNLSAARARATRGASRVLISTAIHGWGVSER